MVTIGLNERILKMLDEKMADSPIVIDLLKELLNEESNHSGLWRYKGFYKNKIEEFLKK